MVDRIGQVVDVRNPGPAEETNPVAESRMVLEGNHEAGSLADLLGQNAGWVGEGSIGESIVAVETSVDLAVEVVVAETAAAVAVDFAGPLEEVRKEVAAAGSELAASTQECRLGERSACKLLSAPEGIFVSFKSKDWILCISEGRQRNFPHDFALSVI